MISRQERNDSCIIIQMKIADFIELSFSQRETETRHGTSDEGESFEDLEEIVKMRLVDKRVITIFIIPLTVFIVGLQSHGNTLTLPAEPVKSNYTCSVIGDYKRKCKGVYDQCQQNLHSYLEALKKYTQKQVDLKVKIVDSDMFKIYKKHLCINNSMHALMTAGGRFLKNCEEPLYASGKIVPLPGSSWHGLGYKKGGGLIAPSDCDWDWSVFSERITQYAEEESSYNECNEELDSLAAQTPSSEIIDIMVEDLKKFEFEIGGCSDAFIHILPDGTFLP